MGLRYGQGKYGEFKYGPADQGFQFRVEISTAAGVIQALANNQVSSLSWGYSRIGGCGKFKCTLKRQFDSLTNLTATNRLAIYDFKIYITSGIGGSSTLYYRGMITSIRPSLTDSEEVVIGGEGYGSRLESLLIHDGYGAPKTYSASTISGVVTSIINDFITPNTPITAGTIDTFSTVVDSITFNGSAEEALSKLAEIVDAEWGVDRNLEIYFRTPSTSVGNRWLVGKDIGELDDEFDYSEIVNRVIVDGGDVDGEPFRYVQSDQASITAFGLREDRVRNSSVIDNTVAARLAGSVLSQKSRYVRNMRVRLPFNKTLLESSNPLPLVVVINPPKMQVYKYGALKYLDGKYCGEESQRISSIEYELKDLSLDTTLELNFGKPDITDNFKLLEFELEQQRQAQGV